mgnify:CR=1 FL=1
MADHTALLPAQRTEIDATFKPALLKEFDNILRSQFQSVKVVPADIPKQTSLSIKIL